MAVLLLLSVANSPRCVSRPLIVCTPIPIHIQLGLLLHLITFESLINFCHLRQVRRHWARAPKICGSIFPTIFYSTGFIPYWQELWGILCVEIISCEPAPDYAHIARRRKRLALNSASGPPSHLSSENLRVVAFRHILRSIHLALPVHLDPSSPP